MFTGYYLLYVAAGPLVPRLSLQPFETSRNFVSELTTPAKGEKNKFREVMRIGRRTRLLSYTVRTG